MVVAVAMIVVHQAICCSASVVRTTFSSGSVDKPVGYGMQHLQGLASWLPPQAGMFMWMKLEGGVKDADDIIDALKDEQVAVVPGVPLLRVAST